MEDALVNREALKEHTDNIRFDKDGGNASGVKSKRAKSGASGSDFGKPGKSFDPDTILLSKKPNLSAKDVECPICWGILYEPTTLPCNHSLCTGCFLQHAEETSLYCPCCRRRLSIWSRKAKKRNELLDKDLWERLKKEFPDKIAARENEDSQDVLRHDEVLSQPSVRDGVISETPGAIFDELKKVIKPHEEDLEKQRREAEAASIQLIQKLQEEEMRKREIQKKTEDEDMRLAKNLQEEYLRSNRGSEKKARKSDRVRTPCSFLNEYFCPLDTDVKRKSSSKNKSLASRKKEKLKLEPSVSAQINVVDETAAPAAHDDSRVQGAKLEPMLTEIGDHQDRSVITAEVGFLEQRPGSSLQEMETENDNLAESIIHVHKHKTTHARRFLKQFPGSSKAKKKTEFKVKQDQDQYTVTAPSTKVCALEHPPSLSLKASESEIIYSLSIMSVPGRTASVDLPEQLPSSSMEEAARETEFKNDPDQSTVHVPDPVTSVSLPEQRPISLMCEREAEISENNDQSTLTVINVNFDLIEQSEDIMHQNQTQDDCIKILEPEPGSKCEERNSDTIQCDVPMSALQAWTSKGFDLSGLSSDDEIIPPSDYEDDGEQQQRPSSSGLSFSFDISEAGSDEDDRMSVIIDYEMEEAQAAAWYDYRKTLEQEAEDRAYALTLQRQIDLGIDSERSRCRESENKYGLRTWTRGRKTSGD